jgi:hypothetical protein
MTSSSSSQSSLRAQVGSSTHEHQQPAQADQQLTFSQSPFKQTTHDHKLTLQLKHTDTNSISTKASSIFAIHRSLFLHPHHHPHERNQHSSSKHAAHSEPDHTTHHHSTEEPTESDSEDHTSTPRELLHT